MITRLKGDLELGVDVQPQAKTARGLRNTMNQNRAGLDRASPQVRNMIESPWMNRMIGQLNSQYNRMRVTLLIRGWVKIMEQNRNNPQVLREILHQIENIPFMPKYFLRHRNIMTISRKISVSLILLSL